jgi:glycerol-3-phosphate dehydrogenase
MGFFARDPLRDRQAVVDKGGRLYFIVPWRDRNIVGTFYTSYQGNPEDCVVTEGDIAAVLAELNTALAGDEAIERHEVVAAHAGLLPLADRDAPGLTLAKRQQIMDGRQFGLEGLVALVGVKYTTAQIVADQALRRIMPRLGRGWSRLPDSPLPGGEHWNPGDSEAGSQHLREQYGTRHQLFLQQATPDWLDPVVDGDPTLKGEIIYAVRAEMAQRLNDVLFRRTLLGSRGYPGRGAIESCGAVMAGELGWGAQRLAAEIADAESRFGLFRS